MPTYRVIGDVLRAFSIEVTTPALGNDDELKEQVAAELGLHRYGRDEGLRIDDVIELDANGNEPDDRG